MPKINYILADRAHLKVRDQVAFVLTDEMANQAAMSYDDDLLLPFYIHRSKPVTPDECPVGVVSLNSGKFDNQTLEKSDGTFDVLIDIYQNAFSNDETSADILSSLGVHKIAGVAMGILESPIYKTLGFAPPFIQRSRVSGFESGEVDGINKRNEAVPMSVVRITLNVKATQAEQLLDAIQIGGNDTTVKLNQTDKGFVYIFNA